MPDGRARALCERFLPSDAGRGLSAVLQAARGGVILASGVRA
jgi:hypothetical protein